MNDSDLLRYSRQILLPEWGVENQERILNAKALIIGLGGLGSPAALYLAAAGVGHLHLVDGDQVDLSNLQRQIIHSNKSIGEDKVSSAKQQLLSINPNIRITTSNTVLDTSNLTKAINDCDIVLDCTDNFASRFSINTLCHREKTPLVSGAAIRWEGQVSVFTYSNEEACYQCIYPDNSDEELRCSENGVLAPIVGIIGSIQACEALKQLTNVGQTLGGRLLILDGLTMQWRTMKLRQDPDCSVCKS